MADEWEDITDTPEGQDLLRRAGLGPEWEDITDQPMSTGRSALGAGLSALQGATANFGDEIVGGVGGLFGTARDLVSGKTSIGQIPQTFSSYRQGTQQNVRDFLSQYREQNPVMATVADVGGSLMNPALGLVSKGAMAGARAIPKIGKAAGAVSGGATLGALYGAGAADQGDRLSGAMEGAATGAITEGVLKGVGAGARATGNFLSRQVQPLKSSAMGITAADRAKVTRDGLGEYEFIAGQHPIDRAIKTVEDIGITKKGLDPEDLMRNTFEKTQETQRSLTGLLDRADAAKQSPVKFPTLERVRSFVNNERGTERVKLKKLLEKEIEALKDGYTGSLADLQAIKQSLYNKGFETNTDPKTKGLYRRLAREFKELIESEVDTLAKDGKLPESAAGAVKKLNRVEGDLVTMQDVFTAQASKEGAQDKWKGLINILKTTGGFGVPIIVSQQQLGDPVPGIAGGVLAASLMSPRGRYNSARMIERLPKKVGSGETGSSLLRALIATGN